MEHLTADLRCIQCRLANDRRPGRLLDSEIIIDFKILVGVVLRSVQIVSIIGWNRVIESKNLVAIMIVSNSDPMSCIPSGVAPEAKQLVVKV